MNPLTEAEEKAQACISGCDRGEERSSVWLAANEGKKDFVLFFSSADPLREDM